MYFGRPVNVFNTDLDNQLLKKIARAFPGIKIEDPNQPHHQEGYNHFKKTTGNGMNYYTGQVLPSCRSGIFLPFRNGAWGAGVFKEAKFYYDRNDPIFVITHQFDISTIDLSNIQPLTIEETRLRIRTPSGETIPY